MQMLKTPLSYARVSLRRNGIEYGVIQYKPERYLFIRAEINGFEGRRS